MVDPVLDAVNAGIRELCEEYLPEGITKRPPVDHRVPGITWHFVGELPPQKIHLAVEFFEWIHSVDRITTIRSLSEAVAAKGKKELKLLVEVNPLGKRKRMGASPEEVPFLIEAVQRIPGVRLMGLSMKNESAFSAKESVEAFRAMEKLRNEFLNKGVLPTQAIDLAMGSSRDFEEAISRGATIVRLGKAVFGTRAEQQWADEGWES